MSCTNRVMLLACEATESHGSQFEVLKVNLFHLQVRPFGHFHFLPLPAGHVSRNMKHFEARNPKSAAAPEGIEAKLQHPVGFFLDLPNLSNDVLTVSYMFHDS